MVALALGSVQRVLGNIRPEWSVVCSCGMSPCVAVPKKNQSPPYRGRGLDAAQGVEMADLQ